MNTPRLGAIDEKGFTPDRIAGHVSEGVEERVSRSQMNGEDLGGFTLGGDELRRDQAVRSSFNRGPCLSPFSSRRLCVLGGALIATLSLLAALVPSAPALPPGRHYEMVSPVFKGGYGITAIEAADPTGEGIAYRSLGAFAGSPADQIGTRGNGNTYVSHRGADGWTTTPLMLPASLDPYGDPGLVDISPNFQSSIFVGRPGTSMGNGQFEATESDFFLHPTYAPDTPAQFSLVEPTSSPRVESGGASRDFSHIILQSTESLTPEAKQRTAAGVAQYDLLASGPGAPSVHMIGVDNQGKPKPIDPNCAAQLGGGLEGGVAEGTAYNAVSANGQKIFFWTCTGGSDQLYVRLDGERTLEVSRSLEEGPCIGNGVRGEVPCSGAAARPSAEFAGASEDGSIVYFVTAAKLDKDDTDSALDLYAAHLGCPEAEPECQPSHEVVTRLSRVTRTIAASEDPGLQGVAAVSPDGSRVYFVAQGVLSGPNGEGRTPVAKADNLYVYDEASGSVAFVAELCSDIRASGEVPDERCPVNSWIDPQGGTKHTTDDELWASVSPPAQVTADGEFLLFASFAQLTPGDTDNAIDVYRYDAATQTLVRVSVGEDGYDANGNGWDENGGEAANASFPHLFIGESRVEIQTLLGTRAMTEDGSRIVFATAEPLSPEATNGLLNGYEWHNGAVSLVSNGSDPIAVGLTERMTISPSGSDIFFTTAAPLLSQDTDDAADVYDARLGPGFPEPPASEAPCSGDACQGPFTNPAPLLVPGSVSQAPGEDVESAPLPKHASAVRKKHAKKRRRQNRLKKRTSRARRRK